MSVYLANRILKPKHFGITHLNTGASKKPPYVIGFDSEADKGYPFLYQFGYPDGSVDLVDVPAKGKYATLFTFIDKLYNSTRHNNYEYVIFGFNLQYEFTQLFRDLQPDTILSSEFQLGTPEQPCDTGHCKFVLVALNDKRYSCTIIFGRDKKRIRFLDAMAFFPMSLNAAGEVVGIGRKEKKPIKFGRRWRHDEQFIRYAEQDARLTQKLGEYIVELHREYDVALTTTAPHFASRTFRRQFLKTQIPLPEEDLEQLGLWSYHGGKNGYYLNQPSSFPTVYHVDIKSAYPEAMHQLPDLETSAWVHIDSYIPNKHAIWHVTGYYKKCKYRSLMHDSGWCDSGFVEITTTGYELDGAIERGEFTIASCDGYYLDDSNSSSSSNALLSYVDEFYHKKRYGETKGEIAAAKLFLNSLYGKFFQKVAHGKVGTFDLGSGEWITSDPSIAYDFTAGGLYHPPIAALITGYVRAKIHKLEHDYDSIMTSTDGFFALKPPSPEMIGEELGKLSSKQGSLKIWRERLYIFTYKQNGRTKYIYALHGWHGTVAQLRRVPLTLGIKWHYKSQAMITLKMSTHKVDGKFHKPGEFITRKLYLDLTKVGVLND